MTTATTFSAEDLAIDHELADIAQSFRFLLDLTPVDIEPVRAAFLRKGEVPTFTYRPLKDDLEVLAARIAAVPIDDVQDGTLGHLLRAKRRELELQVEMLAARDTGDFLALSLELFGTVSATLLAEAEALLVDVRAADAESGPSMGAQEFARLAQTEIDLYRSSYPDIEASVEVREGVSGVMVSNGDLLIAPNAHVPRQRATALLHHEVGTHLVTHINGSHQPLRVLAAGLAGYSETQEGLAVLAEHLVGGLTAGRLRQLAARVVAVQGMVEGGDFAAVHGRLVEAGFKPGSAFTIVMRVFRSGGLTKDAVYLRGLQELIHHCQVGGDLETLWLGKMSLTDLPLVEELRDRGALSDPLLRPRYIDDVDVQERLAALQDLPSLPALIGGPP